MGNELTLALSSGLEVALRKFQTRDKDLLADEKVLHGGAPFTRLLDAVTLRTVSPGPYPVTKTGNVDWSEVLEGEREIVTTKLRIHTWPLERFPHEHKTKCRCRKELVTYLPIDLMKTQDLSPEGLEHVRSGKPIETAPWPSNGKRARFRLLRGKDEKSLEKLRAKNTKLASATLKAKILDVDGVEKGELATFLENLDGEDEAFLDYELGRFDTGTDPEVDTECAACGYTTRVRVPVGAAFLFPSWRAPSAPEKTS